MWRTCMSWIVNPNVCASMEWLYSTHSLSSVTNASSCQEVTRTNHIRQEFVLYLAGEMEGGGGGRTCGVLSQMEMPMPARLTASVNFCCLLSYTAMNIAHALTYKLSVTRK